MRTVLLIRGEFIIDLIERYKKQSKDYERLMRKIKLDNFIQGMIRNEFLDYTGGYESFGDEYPSYISTEIWIDDVINDNDTDMDVDGIMDILIGVRDDIVLHVDESVSNSVSDKGYIQSSMKLEDFVHGTFLVQVEKI